MSRVGASAGHWLLTGVPCCTPLLRGTPGMCTPPHLPPPAACPPAGDDGASDASEAEEPRLSVPCAMVMLSCITFVVATASEFLTGSIEEVADTLNVSQGFIGMIVLPIAGNACEHITAVVVRGPAAWAPAGATPAAEGRWGAGRKPARCPQPCTVR